jgi:molybdate transport system regulatory protein
MPLSEALTPHLNLWLEQDGQVVLSVWRVQLLAAIAETGSISAAAERMKVQYRLAWDRLDQMERGLGLRLVDRHAGGAGGGGASLTTAGHDLMDRFNAMAAAADACLLEYFQQFFGNL